MSETLKKHIIRSFARATNLDGFDANKVILATAAGLISGKLSSTSAMTIEEMTEECGSLSRDSAEKLYESLLTAARETYKEEVEGSDGYILLTDAAIRDKDCTYNVGNMVVFYDQIIGISLGKFD